MILTRNRTITMPKIGMFTWNVPENRIYGDETFAEIYGLSPKHAVSGVPIEEILLRIFELDRPEMAKRTHEGILNGRLGSVQYRIMTSGKLHSVSAFGRCLKDEDGIPSFFSGGVGSDVRFAFASNDG